jgi:acyl-CoA synthetase (AMP-forming)/AMP-acid ligase II
LACLIGHALFVGQPTVPQHLLEALRAHADPRSRAVFCRLQRRGRWQELGYRELLARSQAYAACYHRRGLVRGQVVLVILEHSLELFPAFLGAMLAGCIPSYLPFPSRKQDAVRYWEAHAELFERLGDAAVVTWPANALALAQVLDPSVPVILPDEVGDAPAADSWPATPAWDDVALVQHSSGTTGRKRGVALTFRAIAEQIDGLCRAVDLRPDDRIATWLPLYHDMGLVACLLAPLTRGASIVALDPFEWAARPGLVLHAIEHHRCTHTFWPNFAFLHVARTAAGSHDLRSMKAFVNCSEPCKPAAFDAFLARFADAGVRPEQLQACYAMAETVFAVTCTRLGKPAPRCEVDPDELARGRAAPPRDPEHALALLSSGRPIDGARYEILDPEGRPLPDGHVGELAVAASFLFSGYFRSDHPPPAGGIHRTGDLGLRIDGELYVLGRQDDRIIVCGKNVFAHDIEAVASAVPGVKPGRVVALGAFAEALGSERLVVLAEGTTEPEAWPELRARIRRAIIDRLDLLPHDVRVVAPGFIAKTTSGKTSRADNLAHYLSLLAPPTEPAP